MKELAVIGVKGVNLEKPVGRARITVVFDKKYVPNSDMERVMELGGKAGSLWYQIRRVQIQLENTENVICPSRNKKPCKHFNNGMS